MTIAQYKEKYKNDRFYKEIFETEIYSPVKSGIYGVVIDVGALAGEFSIWIKDQSREVYAIEPEPKQFKELEENVEDFDNIFPFELALLDHNGATGISPAAEVRGGFHTGSELEKKAGIERVECMTLASFMELNGITSVDVLKIDIEGAEKDVFLSKDFEKVASQIKVIIGEHLEGPVANRLKEQGFKEETYSHGRIFRR